MPHPEQLMGSDSTDAPTSSARGHGVSPAHGCAAVPQSNPVAVISQHLTARPPSLRIGVPTSRAWTAYSPPRSPRIPTSGSTAAALSPTH